MADVPSPVLTGGTILLIIFCFHVGKASDANIANLVLLETPKVLYELARSAVFQTDILHNIVNPHHRIV